MITKRDFILCGSCFYEKYSVPIVNICSPTVRSKMKLKPESLLLITITRSLLIKLSLILQLLNFHKLFPNEKIQLKGQLKFQHGLDQQTHRLML